MAEIRWVLLPGLDGSGRLFEEFVRCRPHADVSIARYPLDPSWRLDDYVDHVEATIDAVLPCVVVAESFSGPIALRLQQRDRRVAGVVLAASFVERRNALLGVVPPLARVDPSERSAGSVQRISEGRAGRNCERRQPPFPPAGSSRSLLAIDRGLVGGAVARDSSFFARCNVREDRNPSNDRRDFKGLC